MQRIKGLPWRYPRRTKPACLPARRIIMPTSTPIRKQSSVTQAQAGQRGRARHQDPTRQDPNCAPRQRFSLLPARERGPIERGRRRAQEQEEEDEEEPTTGWDGRGEGGGMPCGWPEWNCSPLL
ncbi:hypothetical protein PVAP13_1KG444700 [Panicum virgatum]|uniref:Uncharacterized protein n=1 Tax=Panicum virgatum TaxID=38727 RepID=A0A8T0XTM9_PANVG|nr:hypothetical protein PVAP13_1KG444700 [Panicum virgatum]